MEPTKLVVYLRKQRASVERYQSSLRDKAMAILGGKCASPGCRWVNEDGSRGCKDKRCLQIDHKKGGGGLDRKRWKSIQALYRFIIHDQRREEWFQLLCANCNWVKRAVEGEAKGDRRGVELPPIQAEYLKEEVVPALSKPQDDPLLRPLRYWIAGEWVWRASNGRKLPVECPFPIMAEDEFYDEEWLRTYYSEVLPRLTIE